MRSALVLVLCLAFAAAALPAEQSFTLPAPGRARAPLFEAQAEPAPEIQRGGALKGSWPWDGIEISFYSGLYPVWLAASQILDVGVPFLPWFSVVAKAEVSAGLLFTGSIFDLGFRGHYNFSKTVGVYGEFTGRFGVGELTIAEIAEDFFEPVVDAGVDSISGFGFSLAGGVELGGRNVKFFAGLQYSALFVDTSLFVEDFTADLPTITISYFGFQLGMRFYIG